MLKVMRHVPSELKFTHILPYGAVLHDDGVQFVVFSRSATAMRVLLYESVNDREPVEQSDFHPQSDRWGDIWSLYVPGVRAGQLYHFQASGPYDPARGFLFDPTARLIDPYAKALAGRFFTHDDGIIRPPKCVVIDDAFDWAGDRHLRRPLAETVIYEMHVRGFTRHQSSHAAHPGTYLGVIEKIPYLQQLGVTAVELMPIHEFPIEGFDGLPKARPNYWGYDPLCFFAPHRGYAASSEPGAQVNELKLMVKELHAAGIEVILDVVFNHTCEGNEQGPILSLKGLENSIYYMLEPDPRHYRNYSGCGNTVNGNHPIVRELIFHCLRHWVHNYHIDGFRFDLASILSRDRRGNLVANPPLVELIAEDPMLRDTKIIAEAWDAAGAFQVGSFGGDRWAEWNGHYRDDVRRYWRGDPGLRPAVATRLAGSSDLYQSGGRPPYCSINFVTSHDGFTLNDLVTYATKHNLANGEDNRDGDGNNHSANYGHEGPTDDPELEAVRLRQIKNLLVTLMVSQGVPMILAGDECQRTQLGNNNAYCQDNEISWFDWRLVDKHAGLVRLVRELICFRRNQPTVRRTEYLTGQHNGRGHLPDAIWFNTRGTAVNWNSDESALGCVLAAPGLDDDPQQVGRDVMMLLNPTTSSAAFLAPAVARTKAWQTFVDTSAQSPHDIFPGCDGPALPASGQIILESRSMRVYVAAD